MKFKVACSRALLSLPADSNWGPHDWESVELPTEPQQFLQDVKRRLINQEYLYEMSSSEYDYLTTLVRHRTCKCFSSPCSKSSMGHVMFSHLRKRLQKHLSYSLILNSRKKMGHLDIILHFCFRFSTWGKVAQIVLSYSPHPQFQKEKWGHLDVIFRKPVKIVGRGISICLKKRF